MLEGKDGIIQRWEKKKTLSAGNDDKKKTWVGNIKQHKMVQEKISVRKDKSTELNVTIYSGVQLVRQPHQNSHEEKRFSQ